MPPRGVTRDRVFRYVRDRLLQGSPPTVREVQQAMGFRAVQTARQHLESLVRLGRLEKDAGKSRGYRLPDLQQDIATYVPLLGRVQAGPMTEAVQEFESYIAVQTPSDGEYFALRVRGESMRDAAILPDDIVIVRCQPSAESGQIVVAMVDGEATVKTLQKKDGVVLLVPANPDFEVIQTNPETVTILGRVVEVRRHFG